MPDHIIQLADGTLLTYDEGPKNFKEVQLKDIELRTLPEDKILAIMTALADTAKIKNIEKG
jgi:hypothetical protein